jgi:hypothetical protein
VSFATITLCVAPQRVFVVVIVVYFVIEMSGIRYTPVFIDRIKENTIRVK